MPLPFPTFLLIERSNVRDLATNQRSKRNIIKITPGIQISYKVRLSNLIVKGALMLGIFVILGNPGSKVAWVQTPTLRSYASYPMMTHRLQEIEAKIFER